MERSPSRNRLLPPLHAHHRLRRRPSRQGRQPLRGLSPRTLERCRPRPRPHRFAPHLLPRPRHPRLLRSPRRHGPAPHRPARRRPRPVHGDERPTRRLVALELHRRLLVPDPRLPSRPRRRNRRRLFLRLLLAPLRRAGPRPNAVHLHHPADRVIDPGVPAGRPSPHPVRLRMAIARRHLPVRPHDGDDGLFRRIHPRSPPPDAGPDPRCGLGPPPLRPRSPHDNGAGSSPPPPSPSCSPGRSPASICPSCGKAAAAHGPKFRPSFSTPSI